MNNLLKVNKILIITLIVFSVGVFGSYSKTASKYFIQDDSDNILNMTSFMGLTKEFEPTSFQIIGEKAQITVEFFRNAAANDTSVTKDEIDFTLTGMSEKCRITKVSNAVTSTGRGFYANESNEKGPNTYSPVPKEGEYQNNIKFTYNDITSNISRDTRIAVTIECDAEDILTAEGDKKDYLQISYRAVETIHTEKGEVTNDEVFRLFGGLYYSNSKYEKPKGYIITGDRNEKLILNTATLNDSIMNEWILKYVTTNFTKVNDNNNAYNYLRNYIDYRTSWDPNTVLGISYDPANKEYTFDDVIMSYAFTSYFAHANKRLYFIHFDDTKLTTDKVEPLFEYYYNTYYKPKYTEQENAEILQYIADNGGISSVVINGNKITGVTYRSNYVVLDKDLIMATLHPVTPDIDLDFKKYPVLSGAMMQYIASSVSDFVKNTLGVTDFDLNKIRHNDPIDVYLEKLQTKANPNDYYYLVVGDKLLSMQFYKKDDGTYAMHMSIFDDTSVDTSATSHVFTAVDTYFRSSTDANDYADLKTQFLRYAAMVDENYGTSFMTDTPNIETIVDALINRIMNPTNGGAPGNSMIEDWVFKDKTKDYTLTFNYEPFEVGSANYGEFSFSFIPPAEAITSSTQSNDELTNAVTTGALSGIAG